jgi:hypothetical protein
MDQQADRIERRLNIDFVMSVCALLISAVACATALYQLRNASLMIRRRRGPTSPPAGTMTTTRPASS